MKDKPAKRPLTSPDNSSEGKAKVKMAGVQHSPRKTASGGNEDLLASIKSMISSQRAAINANVDSKIVDLKTTVELRFNELERKLQKVEEENLNLKERNTDLEKRMSELERGASSSNPDRLLHLERAVRQRNIVATGIEFDTPQQGFDKLNLMIGAVTKGAIRVSGLRAFKPNTGKGIVVAECRSLEDKQCIMRAKKQFFMTVGEETHPVYVDSDLPHQDRVMQAKLRVQAKEMRAQGKDVRLALGRMKVDGEWCRFNQSTNEVEKCSFRKET